MAKQKPIRTLIERSSLGSSDARAATGRYVTAATAARHLQSAAASGRHGAGETSSQGSSGRGHLHQGAGRSNPDQPQQKGK
jgi:hypothetical protein